MADSNEPIQADEAMAKQIFVITIISTIIFCGAVALFVL